MKLSDLRDNCVMMVSYFKMNTFFVLQYRATACDLTTIGTCLEMGDAAVLFATAASIFGAPTLFLLIAALVRRSSAPAMPLDRNDGSSPRSASAAPDAPLEIEHLGLRAEPEP